MDLRIQEGRVFTFGFDKEEEIRKAKGRRLKMVENGAFEDLRHQKCPLPEFPERTRRAVPESNRRAKGGH